MLDGFRFLDYYFITQITEKWRTNYYDGNDSFLGRFFSIISYSKKLGNNGNNGNNFISG